MRKVIVVDVVGMARLERRRSSILTSEVRADSSGFFRVSNYGNDLHGLATLWTQQRVYFKDFSD